MAVSKQQMDAIVITFAQNSNLFQSPGSIFNDIKPAPATLGETAFGEFINGLVAAMNNNGVVTQVVAGNMRSATLWNQVSLSLFGSQA